MTLPRLLSWTMMTLSGFGLILATARAQDEELPSKPFGAFGALNNTYTESRGIAATELPDARKQFHAFAKYYADIVSNSLVHKAAQDPSVKKDRSIPTMDDIISDMQRFLFVPNPESYTKRGVNRDKADYIREMGVALDAALKPLIETHPEPIVRINAARLFAAACSSGATAHYPTLISLLNNANTPTAVKLYLLSAAANLLGAYDVYDMQSRRHSNGWKDTPKGAGDKELAELVMAIEKHVVNPATILNLKELDASKATEDQKEVVRFVRRQAIKALGQVRFAAIPGLDGKTIYPANALARVCVSDPSLGVEPSASECAEAAIGICNMSMFQNGQPIKGYNADTAAEAVTAALVTFAGPRARNPEDKTLPWRGYGLRFNDAIKNWGQMFDFAFNPVKSIGFDPSNAPASIAAVYQRAEIALFTPLQKVSFDGKPDLVGGQVLIEDLKLFLKQQRERANRSPLFAGVPGTELYMPGKK